nr:phosphate/phosphite/phosphonate ABC transporter substrate-binding protein [Sporolactobacillus mangiferae]
MILLLAMLTVIFTACSSSSGDGKSGGDKKKETITVVWYPNESADDLKDSRAAIDDVIAKATGKKVVDKLTTDYNIAIEALVSGNAQLGLMGGEGYTEAHTKNADVVPLVVNSGASGTLKDALYHSWISVRKADASKYMKDGKPTIDNIVGKKMSFVSPSSTSGFAIPTSRIIAHFSEQDKYKDLKVEDMQQGGKFFSQVLFGQSHQGSAANLLMGKADVAAFMDLLTPNYFELVSGKLNEEASVLKVRNDAGDPFTSLKGKEFTVLSVTPVLNGPIAMNSKSLSKEDQKKIQDALTSDETANNSKVFAPEGSKGIFSKDGKSRFVKVEDSWYDAIRDLH